MNTNNYRLPAKAGIGHVHLRVSNLENSISFYRDLLGFELTTLYGDQAAFLSAGGYHHHIGLNTWQSEGAAPAPKNQPGLFHTAILLPSRKALAELVKRLIDQEYPLTGASDHGVSEAVYLEDPDGNGVELYCDRPREDWAYREDGSIIMTTIPLDLDDLFKELE